MTPDDLRRLIREELDRKPPAWEMYAKACIAFYEHERYGNKAWTTAGRQACHDECERLEPNATP